MPKLARYLLVWSAEDGLYELRARGENTSYPLREGDAWWLAWLIEHSSFAFQGQQGHLNLLKEARARGSDYWYAYRSQNRRTRKKYAGRTPDLTFPHLEELARTFTEHSNSQPEASLSSKHIAQIHLEPLLEPKFHPPRMQTTLVRRERLFTRLNAGLECKLTLLCAPAGFGKTTLTGQWLSAHTQLPPLAWISLDSGDNDPIRFWRYIITACQRFYTGIDHAPLTQILAGLSPAFEPPSLDAVLTSLLNTLVRSECVGLLVLEDYHLITAAHIHETLIFFLDHLPAGIHMVMLTRSEPPFPLVRWRARGELCEVQAADLRFSQEESAHFFQQALNLLPSSFFSEERLYQINDRVEGWATGLRLLALTLQRSLHDQELERILTNFAGDQRSLQEYFVTEVLNAQPEPLQHFLLSTSILSRLTGSLCDAVAEWHESERLLESLERTGLFLESLDGSGEWYRYHALFAEAMRAEARRRLGIELIRSLYRKASQWYTQQEMQPEAVEAAFQAQDTEQAAMLIDQMLEDTPSAIFGIQIYQKGIEFHTLRRWLEQVPEEILWSRPLLCLCYAASITFVFFLEQHIPPAAIMAQVEKTLQMAETGWRREGNGSRLGQVFAFRAMILKQPVIIPEAVSYARQALELLSADEHEGKMMSLWLIGVLEIQQGHYDLARETLLEVRSFIELLGSSGILRANTVWLGRLDYAQGELQQAAESFRRLLVEARTVEDDDDICDALLGLARLSYEWNEMATAEQQAQEAFDLAQQLSNHELQVQATLILAHIELARNQIPAAQQRCVEQLTSLPTNWPQHTLLVREIQIMQAKLALAQDDFAALARWWSSLVQLDELPRDLSDREALLWVRWQLRQDQAGSTLDLLENLLLDAQAGRRIGTVWEIQLLMALAHAALKHLPTAQKQLRELLERVHSAGYVRLFLDEGEPLAALLQATLPTVRGDAQRVALKRLLLAFAQQRTAAGNAPSTSSLVEPLSAQEQNVLHLLASGLSNPEIAHELIVSVNTVKAQVQSIYRKLNVTNRVEASEVARMLKLI